MTESDFILIGGEPTAEMRIHDPAVYPSLYALWTFDGVLYGMNVATARTVEELEASKRLIPWCKIWFVRERIA